MEKKIIPVVATAIVLVTLFGTRAAAQNSSGTIRGTVVDPGGAALAGAAITVINIATGAERTTSTDNAGRFVVPGLRVGPYEVLASRDGFAPRRQEDIRVDAGATAAFRLELTHAAAADTLTIAPVPRVIEASRSHAKEVVSDAELVNLPIRGRDAIDLVALAPGAFLSPGRLVIVNGASPVDTSVVVDGTDRSAVLAWSRLNTGTPRTYPFALESLQQLVVNTTGYPAEYGGATAATIHVVTKSGSNALHGAAFVFLGDDALTSRTNEQEQRGDPRIPSRYVQLGATAGAPLVFNRHFIFGSFDHHYESNASAPPRLDRDTMLVRSDHQFGTVAHVTARYNGQEAALTNTWHDRRLHLSGGTTLGNRWFNETRAQYGTEGTDGPAAIDIDHLSVGDTVTLARGAHEVKSGLDVDHHDVASPGFLPVPVLSSYAWFAQDQWQLSSGTTVNAGVRFDGERVTAPGGTDTQHWWSPRLGIAWSPRTGRGVLRAAYGMFAGTPDLDRLLNPVPLPSDRVMHQVTAGGEWEWMPHVSVGATYQHTQGDDPAAGSKYDAVTFELLRRFAQGVHYRIAYTFSQLRAGRTDLGNYPGHHLALSTIYDTNAFAARVAGGRLEPILRNWTVSGIYTVQSDTPRAFASIDPRLARNIALGGTRRLALIWEAYNLTNRPNDTTVPLLDRPIRRVAHSSRVMQIAARFSF